MRALIWSFSHAAHLCGAHILRGARAHLRGSQPLVDVLCLIIPLGALWMCIIFSFLACVFDTFAFQNAVRRFLHLPRRASWHSVGWLLDGHWNLERNYADIHMIYMYRYKRYVGDPDICIFTYLLFEIGCSLTGICLGGASWHCVGWLLDGHLTLKRNCAVYAYVYICIRKRVM